MRGMEECKLLASAVKTIGLVESKGKNENNETIYPYRR